MTRESLLRILRIFDKERDTITFKSQVDVALMKGVNFSWKIIIYTNNVTMNTQQEILQHIGLNLIHDLKLFI